MNTLVILDFNSSNVHFVGITKEQTKTIADKYDNDVEAWVVEHLEDEIGVDMTNCQYMFVEGKPNIIRHYPGIYRKIAKELTIDLEDNYTDEQMLFIEKRLFEIAEENNLTSDDIAYYCDANSSEMFSCIFDYKKLDINNFEM